MVPKRAWPGPHQGLARTRLLALSGGDGDLADRAGNFDVIVRDCRFVVRALQPHVVTQIAEAVLVENKGGGPALEMNARGGAGWAAHVDL